MKKVLITLIAASLVAGALAAPAAAGKKKKKPKGPAPVATTFYMHGSHPLGELDGAQWLADTLQGAAAEPMKMDGTPPSGTQTKSQNVFSPALNDQCSGLPIAFPTWQGAMSGTITGDAKLTAHFLSAPGTILVRMWSDVAVFTCNDAYPEPFAEAEIQLPSGQGAVEVMFEDLNVPVTAHVIVEIVALSGTDYKGQIGRVLYDSTSAETKFEFLCVPASGTSCLPS